MKRSRRLDERVCTANSHIRRLFQNSFGNFDEAYRVAHEIIRPVVIAGLKRLGCPPYDAAELVDESIAISLDKYDPSRGSFHAFVFTVAKNKWRDSCRDKDGEQLWDPTDPFFEQLAMVSECCNHRQEKNEFVSLMHQGLQKLKEYNRRYFDLLREDIVHGIASGLHVEKQCGIPAKQVPTYRRRARKHLKRFLMELGIERTLSKIERRHA